MNKRALITGVTGQDGSYLADLLLSKDYEVVGLARRTSTPNTINTKHLKDNSNFCLLPGDLTDLSSLERAVSDVEPHEVYNLGAQSFVGTSWEQPQLTTAITGVGCLNMLEAVRRYAPYARFYQASSSEQFGKVRETPQNELTPFHPRSPYGVAKCYAHHMTVNYRESYEMHASCGILFNHESPRRGLEFVTRKVSNAVARIHLGLQDKIKLGSLHPQRDWGDARDYVEAMWLMLQQPEPDDYVIATGETRSIEHLLALSFAKIHTPNWEDYFEEDSRYLRPAEVDLLVGDASKAKENLNWEPKISFAQMLSDMIDNDIALESN